MSTEFSLYRIRVPARDLERFLNSICEMRPKQSKIRRIDPNHLPSIDVVLSEEELVFLTLTFSELTNDWLQEWNYNEKGD